ncbi:uncharacterized protein LODBEIA_P21780 [Lodderomyces beijingensis]|uniref:Peptidyl-prolyl cis-trans isomerase n=1 Tax=Lodderomyces beijingensis TaxID=1775926 RepID=A0ABP0ZJA7_9ASCO
MLLRFFLCLAWALAAVVPPGISTSSFHLTDEEKQHLTGDPKPTHKVTFTISQGAPPSVQKLGTLSLVLFGETVPITVENFYQLSSMSQGYGYVNSRFHRIINNFMIQGGDYGSTSTGSNGGASGKSDSIYGASFADENFELKHDKLGRLSMANAGANTNAAQFFILNVDATPHLDGKHVVFGQLVAGFDTLAKISTVECVDNKPIEPVYISDIDTSAFDVDMKEAEQKAEQIRPEEEQLKAGDAPPPDVLVESEISSSSALYAVLFLVLLIGLVGVVYFKKFYKRESVTDIRSYRKF